MATVKKVTKKERFATLLTFAEVQSNPEMVEFIQHEIELLEKKNSTERKPTAKQMENDTIKDAILEVMTVGTLYTITDLIKTVPECADLNNQRVSALVRGLVQAKLVVREEIKRKAYFRLSDSEDDMND